MDTLLGITFGDWWRLLRENRFAVDRPYLGAATALTLRSLANSRGRRREERRFGAEIAGARVERPIFVLGHWRSGTTLLHELLARDARFAYPNLFEISNPHTFLCREDAIARLLDAAAAERRPMDAMEVTFRSPGEDEVAVSVASRRSPMLGWAFPRREAHYDRYYTFRGVPADDAARWLDALDWFLRKLTVRYRKPLVLKSPAHTGRVRLLLARFPDARFVHIHRDPFAVFRSTQQLYATAVPRSHLQRPSGPESEEAILARYADMYDAFFADRALIPPGRYAEVGFEELERDVVGVTGSVYRQLGLDGFDAVRPALEAYAESRAGYRKNEHAPLPAPLRRRIAERWAPAFREWGYAAEPVGDVV